MKIGVISFLFFLTVASTLVQPSITSAIPPSGGGTIPSQNRWTSPHGNASYGYGNYYDRSYQNLSRSVHSWNRDLQAFSADLARYYSWRDPGGRLIRNLNHLAGRAEDFDNDLSRGTAGSRDISEWLDHLAKHVQEVNESFSDARGVSRSYSQNWYRLADRFSRIESSYTSTGNFGGYGRPYGNSSGWSQQNYPRGYPPQTGYPPYGGYPPSNTYPPPNGANPISPWIPLIEQIFR